MSRRARCPFRLSEPTPTDAERVAQYRARLMSPERVAHHDRSMARFAAAVAEWKEDPDHERYRAEADAWHGVRYLARARHRGGRVRRMLQTWSAPFGDDSASIRAFRLALASVLTGHGVPTDHGLDVDDPDSAYALAWLHDLAAAIADDTAWCQLLDECRRERTESDECSRAPRRPARHHPPPTRAPLRTTPLAAHAPPARPHTDTRVWLEPQPS